MDRFTSTSQLTALCQILRNPTAEVSSGARFIWAGIDHQFQFLCMFSAKVACSSVARRAKAGLEPQIELRKRF
jgi:hypothetical protein